MAIEVLAGTVVAHGGARVCVPGGDLHVAQTYAGVERGGYERVPEHVGVHPRYAYAGGGARCLSRRGAAWRSIRVPRALRRIGASPRPSTALSTARATAGGRGMSTPLPPLPRARSTRWP